MRTVRTRGGSRRGSQHQGGHAEVHGPGPHLYGSRRTQANPYYGASIMRYHHFLRLRNLFPDISPHALHGVLELCNGDFIRTVDNIIFTKRINNEFHKKLMFENGRAAFQFDHMNQHFPMPYPGSVTPTGPHPYTPYPTTSYPPNSVGGAPLPSFDILRNAARGRQQQPHPENIGFQSEHGLLSSSSRPTIDLQQTVPEDKSEPFNHNTEVTERAGRREATHDTLLLHTEGCQSSDRPRRSNRRKLFSRKYQECNKELELLDNADFDSGGLSLVQPEVSCEPSNYKHSSQLGNVSGLELKTDSPILQLRSIICEPKRDLMKHNYHSSLLVEACCEPLPEINCGNKQQNLLLSKDPRLQHIEVSPGSIQDSIESIEQTLEHHKHSCQPSLSNPNEELADKDCEPKLELNESNYHNLHLDKFHETSDVKWGYMDVSHMATSPLECCLVIDTSHDMDLNGEQVVNDTPHHI